MISSGKSSRNRDISSQNRDGQDKFDKKAFSARLRDSIAIFGISDAEFSRRSGIPRSALGRYVKGESAPEAGYVVPLSDNLGVSIRWLLTGEGPRERADQPPPSADQEAWLVADYRLLPESNRIVLKAVLDAMLGRLIDTGHPLMRKGDPTMPAASLHAGKAAFRAEGDK